MNIGILGTGNVGQTLAAKLAEVGQNVMIGTRDVQATLARSQPDGYGNPPLSEWLKSHPQVKMGSYADAAAFGELVINATAGHASLDSLQAAGESNLNGKILIDIANPISFENGVMSLTIANTDSLGEQIQRQFPQVKVVKSLNTLTAELMVNPSLLLDGDHDVFVCGNDADARAAVADYLKAWFGWKRVIDLGDITAARGLEMILPVWVRMWGTFNTARFNFKIVR